MDPAFRDHERSRFLSAANPQPGASSDAYPHRSTSASSDTTFYYNYIRQPQRSPSPESAPSNGGNTEPKERFQISVEGSKGRSHQPLTRWFHWWGWETGACLCSLTAFFAIVGFLRAYDGQTQPEWPYGITLNSAISWLSVLTKGFLLVPAAACISQCAWVNLTKSDSLRCLETYDSASRGPWGAIRLFWTLKAR